MAKRKKYEYYLVTETDIERSFLVDSTELFTFEELIKKGVEFYTEIPDINFESYSTKKNSKSILKFKSLTDLINSYLFNYKLDLNDYEEEDRYQIIGDRFEALCWMETILRRNLKTNLFSVVSPEDVQNCFELQREKHSKIEEENQENEDKIEALANCVVDFTDMMDGLIEKETASVIAYSQKSGFYEFCIVKENSKTHKSHLKVDFLKDIKPNKNGFIYENEYDKFCDFMMYNLLHDEPVSITIRSFLSDINKKKKKDEYIMKKLYGFAVFLDNEEFVISNIPAQQLLENHTTNRKTGEKYPPEKDVIYCSLEKDDIICGFELI